MEGVVLTNIQNRYWSGTNSSPSTNDHNCGELDPENVIIEEFAACPRGTVAATIDPQTLEETRRWSSPANPRFSNATQASIFGLPQGLDIVIL